MVIKKTGLQSESSSLYNPMLKGCPAGGQPISHKARLCPHCGHPVKMSELRGIAIALILAIFAQDIVRFLCQLAAMIDGK